MKKIIVTTLTMFAMATNAFAVNPDSVVFHHQATDTAAINKILQDTRSADVTTPARRVAFIAQKLIGTPYEAATLEGDKEQLTVNTSQFDCTTLVENVIALAHTAAVDTATWRDFIDKLLDIRYRNGEIDGYTSRLHYASEWVSDNVNRNNFSEVTDDFPRASHQRKNINYMSTHRRSYALLSTDTLALKKIKDVEKKLSDTSTCFIPKSALATPIAQRWFKDGDIILVTTSTKGLDVMHMGIIVTKNSQPYLLHASSKAKAVVVEMQPLGNYLLANPTATGIRVIRL